jgi:hypothetical protein
LDVHVHAYAVITRRHGIGQNLVKFLGRGIDGFAIFGVRQNAWLEFFSALLVGWFANAAF